MDSSSLFYDFNITNTQNTSQVRKRSFICTWSLQPLGKLGVTELWLTDSCTTFLWRACVVLDACECRRVSRVSRVSRFSVLSVLLLNVWLLPERMSEQIHTYTLAVGAATKPCDPLKLDPNKWSCCWFQTLFHKILSVCSCVYPEVW